MVGKEAEWSLWQIPRGESLGDHYSSEARLATCSRELYPV